MTRFVVLVAIGSAVVALAALGCGDKTDKPPLTPDSDHALEEAGAPATPATPAPATPPGK